MRVTDRLTELLALRSSTLFDTDASGRLLIGSDGPGSTQLFELSPAGEWTQLTDLGEPCTGRYLPESRSVVLSVDDGGTERAQLWLLDPERTDEAGRARRTEFVTDPAYIHTLLDVQPDGVVYATNRRNGVDFDVILRTVSTGAERVLWDRGGWFSETAVSPDLKWVALSRLTLVPASTQLLLVDVTTGDVAEITDAEQPGDWSNPTWAADSSALLSTSDAGSEHRSLRRFDVRARTWSTVLADERCDLWGWPSPDGRRLAVVSTEDGADSLAVYDWRAGRPADAVEITTPHAGSMTFRTHPVWSPAGDELGVTFASPVQPPEVYAWSGSSALERRTTSNPSGATDDLVVPVSHRVPTPDGEQIPVYVSTPHEPDGSAVLVVHGGPEAATVRSWNAVNAALAVAGHTVVLPNVRGSDGYGRRWVGLDDVDKRLDSVADLAAIHAWLPTIGVDASRAALYGGSYGGYMVLAGLTFQPELWAAGVDIVGISSLVTFLENTSAYRRAYREREYGRLEADRAFLEKASPLSRITDIAAPLFVIHGANDPRVPLSEAEQVAAAVRARGLDCELLVYPDEGHGLAKRANRLDAYPRAFAFLDRHLSAGQRSE